MTLPGRYWRTARHLRWQQVLLRPWAALRHPPVEDGPAPPRRPWPTAWARPARRAGSLIAPSTWTLLGETRALDDVGWDHPGVPLLWRYHQHYFDDLNAVGADQRRAWHIDLVERWIREHPPARGTGWAPYPTSLRIANWIKWFVGGAPASAAMLRSLATQVRWLLRRLEWHVLGNHLFVNAKALWMAGRFFDGAEADDWSRTAVAILDTQVHEQILADGGQFERSPMYHALAFEDVLDLVAVLRASDAPSSPLQRRLEDIAPAMHRWLRCMTHPDGTLARFNDTADGIAPSVDELSCVAHALRLSDEEPLPDGFHLLQPSGYVRATCGDAVALFDVAPVAPDYLMAHGHADTLAFELSLRGRRVVVNGGTSRYGTGPVRQRERSTWSHSTVTVEGEDSSEVWAGFRVGRRARVCDLRVDDHAVVASHDGYRHLPGSPLHQRRWELEDGLLRVFDTVRPEPRVAVARFHLAPGLQLVCRGARTFDVVDGGGVIARVLVVDGQPALGLSRFSPRFGETTPTASLDVTLQHGRATTHWMWS